MSKESLEATSQAHPKHFNQELGGIKALPSPQCAAECVPQVVPVGKAASSLHPSVNSFSLWIHGLEMKLHMETRFSFCKSQNSRYGQVLAFRYNMPGSHFSINSKLFLL